MVSEPHSSNPYSPPGHPETFVGETTVAAPTPKTDRFRGTLISAIVFFMLDAFVFSQGVWSMFGAVVLLIVTLVSIRGTSKARVVLVKIAISLILAPAVFASLYAQNALAQSRAKTVVAAVEHYHDDRGTYPKQLDDLVPAYLSSVPRAKYEVFGSFTYFDGTVGNPNAAQNPTLYYTDLPPFGRPTYNFREHRWCYLD